MNDLRFKSAFDPALRFEWSADSMKHFDAAMRDPQVLHLSAGWYSTLGDGDTQHTPVAPCRGQHFTDFCLSFARHLLADRSGEGAGTYRITFQPATAEDVAFLAAVRHKPELRQWFSLQERRVSKSESRRHDKRWHEVPDWADGSVGAAYSLFKTAEPMSQSLLNRTAAQQHFKEEMAGFADGPAWERLTGYYKDLPPGWEAALKALREAVRARNYADSAARLADVAERNYRTEARP